MLAAEIASTIAKPSMIFARNRKVGNRSEIDCGRACFNDPTSNSPSCLRYQNRKRKLPDPKRQTNREWIRGRKPYRAPVESSLRRTKWTGEVGLYELTLHCTGHDRHHATQAVLPPMRNPVCRRMPAPYNFARIPTAKPLSTGAETTLLPFINGTTTCSINQPHNPPRPPPARWPVFVLSNLPASDLVPSRA